MTTIECATTEIAHQSKGPGWLESADGSSNGAALAPNVGY